MISSYIIYKDSLSKLYAFWDSDLGIRWVIENNQIIRRCYGIRKHLFYVI